MRPPPLCSKGAKGKCVLFCIFFGAGRKSSLHLLGLSQPWSPCIEAVEQQTFVHLSGCSRGEVQHRSCGTADVSIISILRCRCTIAADQTLACGAELTCRPLLVRPQVLICQIFWTKVPLWLHAKTSPWSSRTIFDSCTGPPSGERGRRQI